ncbi:hypothetical protein GCK72_020554 [Caenorhabditis remanei]|uniref:Uncharacterized protein n=2 Tax=Caenorhabditis remanei TaxID=31234 RepID=E3MWS5_CAERE|nr:hypothetical protein GCK72_020554 [Caenorhabditis remanei]EFP10724.1 hypothetical protein CRE_02533 [Caenorhabditis remanei]KAF1753996.1 hypothetical protein GCK72_020554 [Caenorhabditis remanei]
MSKKICFVFAVFILVISWIIVGSVDTTTPKPTPRPINVEFFDNVTIPMPVSANYRRIVEMTYGVKEEQIYRVCTGKNKKTCGFWENVETKAKVESGKTTYNKNKKALIIKKIMKTDF